MIIHVKKHGAVVEMEAGDRLTHDEELAKLFQPLRALKDVCATHAMRVLAPVRAAQSDARERGTCEACDTNAFVRLSLH